MTFFLSIFFFFRPIGKSQTTIIVRGRISISHGRLNRLPGVLFAVGFSFFFFFSYFTSRRTTSTGQSLAQMIRLHTAALRVWFRFTFYRRNVLRIPQIRPRETNSFSDVINRPRDIFSIANPAGAVPAGSSVPQQSVASVDPFGR